ncbi:hypothetical protein [Cupriavidus sp. H18C1]|uniref:hypothetical protein n=1 Tax=Cupriavidus sp. H18C1 TaxID=3241601 RepID=UPI003BB87111
MPAWTRGALQAIRLSGRLRVGGQTFCVALRDAGGKPQYVVTSRAPQCDPTKDAAARQALDELAQSIGKRRDEPAPAAEPGGARLPLP